MIEGDFMHNIKKTTLAIIIAAVLFFVPVAINAACIGDNCETSEECKALDGCSGPGNRCALNASVCGCFSESLTPTSIAFYTYGIISVEGGGWSCMGSETKSYCNGCNFSTSCTDASCTCQTGDCGPCTTCPCNQTNEGSSINLKSGNLYHDQDLITTPKSLPFTLSYNSRSPYAGPFGRGWTHTYNLQLEQQASSCGSNCLILNPPLILHDGGGNNIGFTSLSLVSGGTYSAVSKSGDTSTIVHNSDRTYTRTLKDGIVQTFDVFGNLTSIKDRNGNTTTLTYGSYVNGQLSTQVLTGVIDLTGRALTITNSNGKITTIIDPAGNAYTFTYTGNLLIAVTDPLGNAWHYTYDASGRILTKTDPAGFTTTYTYDGNGMLTSATDPNGLVKTLSYDKTNSTARYVEKDGGIWVQTYDANLNLPLTKTDPQGHVTRYTYDTQGHMLSKTESDGSISRYFYDSNGNMYRSLDALGQSTLYWYNSFGQVTSIADPKWHYTNYGYDALGNLTSFQDAMSAITRYQYDTKGNVTSMTDALNKITTLTYDAYNNVATITDPKGAVTSFIYDINGNMLTRTDANNKITTYTYNNLNQLTRITDSFGNITTFTYDKNGNLASQTDANNNATFYEYNYKKQLVQVKDAINGITSLVYGSTGCSSCGGGGVDKLTALMDAKGNSTTYVYDLLGRLTRATDPLGKATSYSYDVKGNLTSRTDANNNAIAYTYDAINRLTKKTYPDNTTAAFTYDAVGNILTAANANISYTFTYDADNRVTKVTDSNNRIVSYTYNALGNRTKLTYPDNSYLTYTYDTANRLSTIVDGTTKTYTFTYDSLNRRTKLTYPSAAINTYGYDEVSRLTGLTNRLGTYTYQYDNVINRTSLTEPLGTHSYAYDNVYSLLTATHDTQPNEQYAYDLMGNRTSATTNSANQIMSDATYTYSYDNNGNMLSRTNASTGDVRTFTWDYENRLIAVAGTGLNAQYKYDPFGRRIQKTVNGTITNSIYDGMNIIAEYNSAGSMVTRYTQGPGIDEHLSMQRSGNVWYYHTDGLGSVTAMTDSAGTVVQTYSYDSFGNIVSQTGSIQQPYTYTGREYDSETGMYYYRARYYDTITGRFISKDPIGFLGGLNLYGYVGNNPVNWIDPLGLDYIVDGIRYSDDGQMMGPIDEDPGLEEPNFFLDPINYVAGGAGLFNGLKLSVNVLSKGNVCKIVSKRLKVGFRIDPAHHGKPWGHPHFWKW